MAIKMVLNVLQFISEINLSDTIKFYTICFAQNEVESCRIIFFVF